MKPVRRMLIALIVLAVAACSGGGGGGGGTSIDPTAVNPVVEILPIKKIHFSWTDVIGATRYRVLENSDGLSGFVQVSDDIATGIGSYDHIVPLFARVNAQYIVQACNESNCTDSQPLLLADTLAQGIGYFKASNNEIDDSFGSSVSLSADGKTLAIGADDEDSAATGINGNQADDSAQDSGAVYVFTRNNGSWTQQAYLKASTNDTGDSFGGEVSLSADGNTLAVGTYLEDSGTTGINGDQTNNSSISAGAVYVFTRASESWAQQAYLKASNSDAADSFGFSISLSADGNTLAVGANREESAASGFNGNQVDNSAEDAGAAYVFIRNSGSWTQQAYLKASNTNANDLFGFSVSLSADGNTLAVGALSEGSTASGIDGNQIDDSAEEAGAVYVFIRNSGSWVQQTYLKASNTDAGDHFGVSVSLSDDGNTLAVGANVERSAATGINVNQGDNSVLSAGAVYVFIRASGSWTQQAYLKASNTDPIDFFGGSVSLSANGNTLAIGAFGENGATTGINGDQADNASGFAGAVYVFTRDSGSWTQLAYLKASNTDTGDSFGSSDDLFGFNVSLSADGNTLAVGAPGEDSSATGIDGNQANNSAEEAGAAYLF